MSPRRKLITWACVIGAALLVILVGIQLRPAADDSTGDPTGHTATAGEQLYFDVEDYRVPGDGELQVSGAKVPDGIHHGLLPKHPSPFASHQQFRPLADTHMLSITRDVLPDPAEPMRLAIQINDPPPNGWLVLAQNISSPTGDGTWNLRTDVNVVSGKMHFSTGQLGIFQPLWVNIPVGDEAALRTLESSIVDTLTLFAGSWISQSGETETLTVSANGVASLSHHFAHVQCGEKLGKCVSVSRLILVGTAERSVTATFDEIVYEDVLPAGVPSVAVAPAVSGLPSVGSVASLAITPDDRIVMTGPGSNRRTFCRADDLVQSCEGAG